MSTAEYFCSLKSDMQSQIPVIASPSYRETVLFSPEPDPDPDMPPPPPAPNAEMQSSANSSIEEKARDTKMMKDIELVSLELLERLKVEEKDKFEIAYGLHIEEEALSLISSIVVRLLYASTQIIVGENCGRPNLALPQENAVELLEKSCTTMIDKLEINAVEDSLDKYEYMLYRAFIELAEIRKEKDHASWIWARRVESEYNNLMNTWETFMGKWKLSALSDMEFLERDIHVSLLKEELVDMCPSLFNAILTHDVAHASYLVQTIGAITNIILQIIRDHSRWHRTVTPRVVAVALLFVLLLHVASPITGVPAAWLLNSWNPPLDGMRKTFAEKLVVQTQASSAIIDAFARRRLDLNGGSRPVGSFLFLGYGLGGTDLLEALAEKLFDTKVMKIFDLFKYTHPCDICVSGTCSRVYKYEDHVVCKELIEHVRKRPFSVLVLHDIDKANTCATKLVLDVMKYGRLVDPQGKTVDFSKSLIIMTSDIGMHSNWVQRGPCKCKEVNQDSPLKEQMGHACFLFPFLKLAKRGFTKEFLDTIDDIIVFNHVPHQEFKAAFRLLLRDAVDALVQKGMIVYPSEAALNILKGNYLKERRITGMPFKTWLKQNVVPGLLKFVAEYANNDFSAIYLDVLVGTDQLTYRLKSGGPLDDLVFKRLRDQLKSWRFLHRDEKGQVDILYSMRNKSVKVINKLQQEGEVDYRYVAELVDDLRSLMKRNASYVVFKEQEVVQRISLKEQRMSLKELRQEEQRKLIAEAVKEGLATKLSHLPGGNGNVFRIVADAVVACIGEPRYLHGPGKSFLFPGLSRAGKAELVKGLAEIFGTNDGGDVVVQINMQSCEEPDLFSQISNGNFPLTWHSDSDNQGSHPEDSIPYRVLIVNEVEKAHISLFDSLISVLDHGLLSDREGRQLNFSNTIIIIISHLGNKEIIGKLLACTCGTTAVEVGGSDNYEPSREKIMPILGIKDILVDPVGYASGSRIVHRKNYKEGQMRFRTELLTRIEEIVLTQEQTMNGARLPMKTGRHLTEGTIASLPLSLSCLFRESLGPAFQSFASSHLSKGLLNAD